MNGLQTLRTAFWSLTISLGVLLLLVILRPEVTGAVTAFFRAPASKTPNASRIAGNSVSKSAHRLGQLPPLSIDPSVRPQQHANRESESTLVAGSFPVLKVHPAENFSVENLSQAPEEPTPHSAASSESINRELNARIISLQNAVEQLTQMETDRRAAELQRTAAQIEQQQQSERLRELEIQLRRLQSAMQASIAAADAKSLLPPVDATPVVAKAVVAKQVTTKPDSASVKNGERFSLQIRRADVTEVLELLGQATGYNIVIGKGVEGTVPSANLRDVTVVEAIDSIIQSLGLTFEQNGQFIYVTNGVDQRKPQSTAAKVTAERDGPAAQ